MLIPHLHFGGDCKNAIQLYEKAFDTKVEAIEYMPDGKEIVHASMKIQNQMVFLNDNFGNKDRNFNCGAVHLVLTFNNTNDLLTCYEILKADNHDIIPFIETAYSKLVGNFLDKFGVLWGFMVVEC